MICIACSWPALGRTSCGCLQAVRSRWQCFKRQRLKLPILSMILDRVMALSQYWLPSISALKLLVLNTTLIWSNSPSVMLYALVSPIGSVSRRLTSFKLTFLMPAWLPCTLVNHSMPNFPHDLSNCDPAPECYRTVLISVRGALIR